MFSILQVPLDERFIYRFFREKKSRVTDEQESDAESVNSDDAMEAIEMFADSGTKDLDFAAALETDQKSGSYRNQIYWTYIRSIYLPKLSKSTSLKFEYGSNC